MINVILSQRRKFRFKGRCAQREGGVDSWRILPANQRTSGPKEKEVWNRFSLTASRRIPEDA